VFRRYVSLFGDVIPKVNIRFDECGPKFDNRFDWMFYEGGHSDKCGWYSDQCGDKYTKDA